MDITNRQYFRYPPINWGPKTRLRTSSGLFPVRVHDESLDGLALFGSGQLPLRERDGVMVQSEAHSRPGIIVYVLPGDNNGETRIGLRWDPSGDYAPE